MSPSDGEGSDDDGSGGDQSASAGTGGDEAGQKPNLKEAEDKIHHRTHLPDTAISRPLDWAMAGIGKAASWLWIVTVGVIVYAVIGRYFFNLGTIMFEEIQWHVAGAAWLLGLAYTLVVDDHVRVDVLHERFSLKTQAWIELLGLCLLLLPFLYFGIVEGVPYAYSSYLQGERSQAPAGLENRWILKSILVLGLVLLAVAAISRLTKATALLFGIPRPLPAADEDAHK